ncbi:MAG: hypothetical protein WDM89_17680 [Rhizomicrobium sp.]
MGRIVACIVLPILDFWNLMLVGRHYSNTVFGKQDCYDEGIQGAEAIGGVARVNTKRSQSSLKAFNVVQITTS